MNETEKRSRSLLDKVRSKFVVTQTLVSDVEWISERLVTVRLLLPRSHVSAGVVPGAHVAVSVDGPTRAPFGAWRRYTVSATGLTDDGQHWFSWIVSTNGSRPGVDFHRNLVAGDTVSVRLGSPESAINALLARCADERAELFLVGDATTIGLLASISSNPKCDVHALLISDVELEEALPILSRCELFTRPTELLDRLAKLILENPSAYLVVAGERSLVGAVRTTARSLSLPPSRIAARVYWTPGKVGPE
jgi:NADPH-dependent ferric siderophore reductase